MSQIFKCEWKIGYFEQARVARRVETKQRSTTDETALRHLVTSMFLPRTMHIAGCLQLFLLIAVSFGHAQVMGLTPDQAPPIPHAGHSYIQDLNETLNPENGAVTIRINVPVPSSRGLTLPFGFEYNSNMEHHLIFSAPGQGAQLQTPLFSDNTGYMAAGGWRYIIPTLSWQDNDAEFNFQPDPTTNIDFNCSYTSDYVFVDSEGTTHPLGISMHEPQDNSLDPVSGCEYYESHQPEDYTVGEDTKVQASVTEGCSPNMPCYPPVMVADLDGTIFFFDPSNTTPNPNSTSSGPPTWIEDRNGNIVSIQAFPLKVTDSAGRPEIAASGFGTTGDTVSVSGLSKPYTLTWGSSASNLIPNTTAITGYYQGGVTGGNHCLNAEQKVLGKAAEVTDILLPNEQHYQFIYDPFYGLLQKLVYPTGAYVRYEWGVNSASDVNVYSDTFGLGANCEIIYDTAAVAHRYVSYDGVNEVLQQDFTYSTTWNNDTSIPHFKDWISKKTTVKSTDLLTGDAGYTVYNYAPTATSPVVGFPVETSVVVEDSLHTPLETKNMTYANPYLPPDVQITRDGLVSGTTRTYDIYSEGTSSAPLPCSNNTPLCGPGRSPMNELAVLGDEYTYDWGSGASGPLLRHVHYDYQQFGPSPIFSAYHISHIPVPIIVDRPSDEITYDGSGNKVSETDYVYDQTPIANGPSALTPATHDETNYSAKNPALRGNVTTVSRLIGGSSYATTSYKYYDTGQLYQKTDPCGNSSCLDMGSSSNFTTTYSYSDSYADGTGTPTVQTFAYPTQITDPLGHINSYTWGYNDGLMRSHTDTNNQTTTNFTYNDPLGRLTQIVYPDGGQTYIGYDDSAPNPSMTVCNLKDTTSVSKGWVVYLSQCPVSGAPSGNWNWIVNTSVLDGMGRTIQTQLTSDPEGTDYIDTLFNGLGQVYKQSNPTRCSSSPGALPTSCAESTWGYTTSSYDVLGRKTQVTHVPDGSSELWSYSGSTVTFTDANNHQWQRRTDGLGRLTKVIEPGSLTTVYGYDVLDNLISVNQNGFAGTDTPRTRAFSYDSLSRLIASSNPETSSAAKPPSLTCSGASGSAWTSCFGYDANGNLISKTDNRGVTTSYSYDPLNRALSKTYSRDASRTPSSCFQYDSSSSTYGIGRLSYAWTQAASAGSCSGIAPQTGFQTKRSFNYDPMGRIQNEQQFTPASQATGKIYAPAYTYDLTGRLIASTDGVTPVATVNAQFPCAAPPSSWTTLAFVNCYNAAGRLLSVTSNWGDGTHPPILFSTPAPTTMPCQNSTGASYAPFGSLMNAKYGNGLWFNRAYDSRLRVNCEIDLGGASQSATGGSATISISGAEQNTH